MLQNYEAFIGKHIKEVRLEKHLSQQNVAEKCGFSNTVLSAYENNKKVPNLITIALIAKALDVSIERLYYGDDNNAFINAVSDEGRKIVNSVYLLWESGVIRYFDNLGVIKYDMPIRRFLNALNEFEYNKDTYPEPEKYLEMIKTSVATEINNEIKKEVSDISQN